MNNNCFPKQQKSNVALFFTFVQFLLMSGFLQLDSQIFCIQSYITCSLWNSAIYSRWNESEKAYNDLVLVQNSFDLADSLKEPFGVLVILLRGSLGYHSKICYRGVTFKLFSTRSNVSNNTFYKAPVYKTGKGGAVCIKCLCVGGQGERDREAPGAFLPFLSQALIKLRNWPGD